MRSTPHTASTGPASSATDTTPTAVGATIGTERKPAPSAKIFARKRRRKKKAMEQVEQLRQLANNRFIEVMRMRDAVAKLEDRLAMTEKLLSSVRGQLDWLANYKVDTNDWQRCIEINTRIRIDPRYIEQGSAALVAYLTESICTELKKPLCKTALAAILKSPITLQDDPDVERIFYQAKNKWLQKVMVDSPDKFPGWMALNYPRHELGALWDDAFEALKALAASIPPDTQIIWAKTPPPKA